MPIIITNEPAAPLHEAETDSLLLRTDGRLTLEGQVIADFLESVDFEEAFEALGEVIEAETIKLSEKDGEIVEGEGEDTEIETLDGEAIAEALDEDDLATMFEHYVDNLPEATIEDKAMKAAGLSLISEERLDEFQKGAFRKMGKKGGAGRALVNRMLGAMIAKQVIKRAKAKGPGTPRKGQSGFTGQGGHKGAGYKGGDYDKNPAGYGAGTGKGVAVWRRFKSGGAGKSGGVKQERKTRAAKKNKGVKYKATMDAGKAKKVVAKKAAIKGKGGALKKAMGESQEPRRDGVGKMLHESVSLATRAIARHQDRTPAPAKKDGDDA